MYASRLTVLVCFTAAFLLVPLFLIPLVTMPLFAFHEQAHAPSTDFVAEFEEGVRYGLLARSQAPTEDSLPVLTDLAKKYYWHVVIQKGH